MQNKESQFETYGICHRLFNLIMKSLFPRNIKSVTLASSGHKPKADADLESEIPVVFKQSEEQVNGVHQEIKISGPKKVVSLKLDSAAEDPEKAKKKGKMKASENFKLEPPPVVRVPRIWSVDSNINEKSDAFITSKKKAMNQLGA